MSRITKNAMMSQLRNSLRGCANINHTITETKWLDTWHVDYAAHWTWMTNTTGTERCNLFPSCKRMHLEIKNADGEKYIVKFLRNYAGLLYIVINPISSYAFGADKQDTVIWESN